MSDHQRQLWITRPNGDGEAMAVLAKEQGFIPWHMPVLDIFWLPPSHKSLSALMTADTIIVTSRHALTSLDKAKVTLPKQASYLAVGQASAQALQQRDVQAQVPETSDSEGLLAESLLSSVEGKSIVILKGEGGRSILANQLQHRGARVQEISLYRRVCKAVDHGMLETFLKQTNIVVSVASGETLSCALKSVPEGLRNQFMRLPLAVMSTRIARFAQGKGWCGDIQVAPEASSRGLVLAAKACQLAPH